MPGLRGHRFLTVCLVALALLAPALAQAAPRFPPLSGRVVDAADILPPEVEQRLAGKLEALESRSRRQLVVVTLPDLQGYDIADYGYQLGRAWGIGDKQRNDGALLIVAPAERKLRIEVGYGLEGVLTDGLSSLIINQTIVPRFRAGEMAGGIEAGTDAIIAQLSLPEEQARLVARKASEAPAPDLPPGTIFVAMFVLFFLFLPFVRTVAQRRRYPATAAGSVFVWDLLRNMPRSGGFSGGGFSGGGGSFGGGGSSGSW